MRAHARAARRCFACGKTCCRRRLGAAENRWAILFGNAKATATAARRRRERRVAQAKPASALSAVFHHGFRALETHNNSILEQSQDKTYVHNRFKPI